ncbi:hypothetical protein PWP93_20890 [Paraburkholderia sp. A1RI-2L]|uniref:hypothetical protein n=1 Tax=Paraburkholderia sp. A1RI-2L TaxID=3028367 RepID=UPI003B7BE601
MNLHSTTQTGNRAMPCPVPRADAPRAAIMGMCGGAPRIQPPPGGQPLGQQASAADKGSRRRAKQRGASCTAASGLASVEVVFYKEILDHRGFPHRCELMRVHGESVERDEAIAGAIFEFERIQCVSHWNIAADGYEVQTRAAVV